MALYTRHLKILMNFMYFIFKVPVGILSREDQISELTISILENQVLSILVENQGHICYGPYMASDFKVN